MILVTDSYTDTIHNFIYSPKASTKDRNTYTSSTVNQHNTVKSIKLMQYFVTLITPPNGTVLDPFSGSGSTGVAALLKGFDFIGVEKELGHYNLAKERLTNCKASLIQPPSTNA